jgi:hypothetical protein
LGRTRKLDVVPRETLGYGVGGEVPGFLNEFAMAVKLVSEFADGTRVVETVVVFVRSTV